MYSIYNCICSICPKLVGVSRVMPSGGTLAVYRGTSLIRNTPLLGPYSRTIPRVLWWS